jgi:hypothetical protein
MKISSSATTKPRRAAGVLHLALSFFALPFCVMSLA